MVKPTLPTSIAAGLTNHFRTAALPLSSLVAMPWSKPLAFLSATEEFHGASIVWPDDASDDGAEVAMLIGTRAASGPTICIEVDVVCLLCHGQMFRRSERFEWIGSEGRGLYRAEALPLCTRCLREEPESYIERLVEALQASRRPTLTVIDGGGEGSRDPERRDHLRLVEDPKGGDEDD
jgi:hypothetical protein